MVKGGKFLDFMLTYRGIETNPEKCEVVIAMRSLENMNEVQKLKRNLVSLSLNSFSRWERRQDLFLSC